MVPKWHSLDTALSCWAEVLGGTESPSCLYSLLEGAFVYQGAMGKLGLIVPLLVNIFHCISVLFVVSKDSEELIQCYTSLRNKEGISSVVQNFKYFRLSFGRPTYFSYTYY